MSYIMAWETLVLPRVYVEDPSFSNDFITSAFCQTIGPYFLAGNGQPTTSIIKVILVN